MEILFRFVAGYPFSTLTLAVLPWIYTWPWLGIVVSGLLFSAGRMFPRRLVLLRVRSDVLAAAVVFLALWAGREAWESSRKPPLPCTGPARVEGFVEREASVDPHGTSRFLLRVRSWRGLVENGPEVGVTADFPVVVAGFRGPCPDWGRSLVTTGELAATPSGGRQWKWKGGCETGWSLWGCEARAFLRRSIFAALARSGSSAAALARALLLGDTDELSGGEKAAFRASGTSHVLALSGMHLSLLALMVSSVARGRVGRPAAFCSVQIVLAVFCWLAGPIPSLYRAWTMATVMGLSRLVWRNDPALESLAQSFLATILLWPDMAGSLSLQLSAAALAGILVLSPSTERALRPFLGRWAAGVISVSGTAVAATAPLSAKIAGGLCWIGVFWTPPMVFLTSVFMVLSIIFLLGALVVPGLPWEIIGAPLTWVRDATFDVARRGGWFFQLPTVLAFLFPAVWGVGALAFLLYKGRRRTSPLPLNYDSPNDLQAFLESQGLNALKRWGQNFLINAGARRQILAALELTPGEPVWEIGPGLGALTHHLIESEHPVTAFEIDPGYVEFLRREFGGAESGFCVVWGDAIKTWRRVRDGSPLEPSENVLPSFTRSARKVVGNLPYNAASAIIADFIEGGFYPDTFVVTVQKEMADRMTASPGGKNYSSFSVLCQAVFSARLVLTLKPGSFYPIPEVASSVVQLKPHNRHPGLDMKRFSTFVRECYSSRRKTLRNNLQRAAEALSISCETLTEAFTAAGIDLGLRAEALEVDRFVAVYYNLAPSS